jgi:hypothetical protein
MFMSICPYLGHAKLLRTYPQLRAGTLEEDFKPPKKVTEMIFPGGCPGDQRIAFRPLAACFGSVLESNQAYNPRTPSFCSLSVVKKRHHTLHPSKTHNLTDSIVHLFPMQSPLPISNPQINKNRSRIQIVIFGKFQVGQFHL